MSAETLRRAAVLMRERAEAATPGPWEGGERIVWSTAATRDPYVVTDGCAGDGGAFSVENTDHIASWHPAVALAVADWLDGAALHLEARADEEWFDLDGDPISPEDTHAIGSALTVARIYLGDADDAS